jgi:hypothetical protein
MNASTNLDSRQHKKFELPQELQVHQIEDFLIRDQDSLFVILNRGGQRSLALFSEPAAAWQVLGQWEVWEEVRFVEPVPGRDLGCARLLVDADLERTRIEEVCPPIGGSSNALRRVVVPSEKYVILSAAERHDGGLHMLVGWHEMIGLLGFDKGVWLDPGAAEFPEFAIPLQDWALGLQPGLSPDQHFVWEYLGGEYGFRQLDIDSLKKQYERSLNGGLLESRFRAFPRWVPYVPPFKTMAQRVHGGLDAVQRRGQAEPDPDPKAQNDDQGAQSEAGQAAAPTGGAEWKPAPYSFDHWFTYPQARPDYFGGPSIGLVSYPLRDSMERYLVFVLGDYNFATEKADLLASFVSRRVLDEFKFDLFSRERFNGLYYLNPCLRDGQQRVCLQTQEQDGTRAFGYHYLRENGAAVSAALQLRPAPVVLNFSASVADLNPSSVYRFSVLGPQHALLATLGFNVESRLFSTAFYMRDPRKPGGSFLSWSGHTSLGIQENVSIGKVRDGNDRELPGQSSIHFQDVSAEAQTALSFQSNSLTLRGSIARTFGDATLNRKQFFSPYRTYLLGAGSAINRVNVPIAGSDSLFRLSSGDWMYRTTLDYRRPIVSDLGARITVLFIESIDVEVVGSRGGVANGDGFVDVKVIDSVSGAIRVNMDIKGFKIFPALAVGQVIGDSQPGLFAEVSFSDFF